MNIERDKVYLTRDGGKARVISVDGPTKNTAIVVQYPNGMVGTRYPDGTMRGNGADHSHDLMKEYREPKVIYVNEYDGRPSFVYSELTEAESGKKDGYGIVKPHVKTVKYIEVMED